MKKFLFLLGGVVTLVACTSDSVLDEIDQQNNEMIAPPTFNNDQPGLANGGASGLIWAGDNYASPWDFWYRGEVRKQPAYLIHNGDAENSSPYNLVVTALVGLAYFDGINDGTFNDLGDPTVAPILMDPSMGAIVLIYLLMAKKQVI